MAKIRKPSKLSKPSKRRKPLSAAAKQKISQGLARVLGPTRGIDDYEPKPKKGTKANKPDAPKTGKNSIPDNLPNSQPLTRKQTRTEGNRPTPKPQRLERPKRPTTLKELSRPQLIEGLEYHRARGNKDAYNRIKQELDTRKTPNAKTSTPDTQIANDQRILQGYQKRQAELRLDREAEARAVLEARGVDTSEWEPIDEDVMNRARKRVERDIQKDTAQRAERRQQREAQQARQQQILERQAEARVILEARGQDTSDWHGIDPELMEAARLRLADQIAKDSTARNARQQRNTPTPTPNTTPNADATPQINTKAIPTVPKTPRKPQKQPTHPNHVQGGGHQASAEYLNPVEIRKEPHYEDDLNQLNAQLAESPTAEQKLLNRLQNAQQRAAENRTNEENRHNQREATRLQVLAEDSGLIPNGNDNDPMGELDDQELDDFNAYMEELDARELETTDTPNDVIPTDTPTPNNMPTTRPGMTEDEKDAQYFTAESQYDPDYEEFLEWQRREHSEPLRNESEETADVDNLDTTTDAPTLSDEELEQRLNQRDNDDTTPDTEPENPTPQQPTNTPETEPATPRPQATDTPDSDGTQPQAKQPTPAPVQPETTPTPAPAPTPAERPAPTTRAAARPEPGTPDALTDEEQKEFDKQAEKEFRKQFTNQSDEELIAELSQLNPTHPRAQALNRELDLRDEDTTSENSNTYLRERSGRGNQGRRQPANTGETPDYNDENQLEQLETAAQQDADRDQFNTQELEYMTFDELDAIDTTNLDPTYAAAVDDAKEAINPEHPGGILDSLKQNATFTDYKRRLTDYDGLENYLQEGEDLNTTDKDQRAALNKRIDDRIKTSLGLAGNPRFAREAEQTEEYFDWENDLFTTQTNADGTIDDIREAGGRLKQGQTGRYGTVDEAETQISTELRDHIINNIGYLPNVENFQRIKRGQAPIPYTEDTAKEIRAERNARARQRPYKTKAQRAAAREQKIFNQNTRAPELERRQAQELQPTEGLEGVGVRAGRKAIMQPDLPQDMRDRPWEKQERIDLIQRHADTLNDKDLLQAVDNAKEDNGFGLGTQDIEETYRAEATKRGLIDAPETPAEPAADAPAAPKADAPKPAKPAAKKTTAKAPAKPAQKPTSKPAAAKDAPKPAAEKDAPKTDTSNPQAKYSAVRKAVIAKNGTPINNQKALKAMSDDDLNTAKTHAEQLKAKNPKSKQHQAVIDAVEKEINNRNKPSTKPTKPAPKTAPKPAATPAKPTKPAETKDAPKPEKPAKPVAEKPAAPSKPAETKPAKPATPAAAKPTKYETQVAQAHENYTPTAKEKKPTNPGLFSTTTGIYGEPRRYSYNPQDGENVNLIHHPEPNTTWHLTKAQYLKNGTTKFTGTDLNTGKPVNARTNNSGWLETRRPIDTSSIYTTDTPQQYHAEQELEKKYPQLTQKPGEYIDVTTTDAYNRREIERTLAKEHIKKNPQDTTLPTFTKDQVEARAKKDAEWSLNNTSSGVKIAVIKPGAVVNGTDNYNNSIVSSKDGRFYAPANTFLLDQNATDTAAEFARLTANPDARIDAGSQGLVQPTKLEKFGYGIKITGINDKGETVTIKTDKGNIYSSQLRQRTPLTYSNGDDLSAADAKAYAQAENAIQDTQVKLNQRHTAHRNILVAQQEDIKRNILNKGTKPTPTTTPAAPKKPTKTTTPDTKEKDLAHRLTGAATKELNSPTKDQQITKVIEEQHDKTQLLDRHPQLKEVYEALQKRNQQQTKTQERRHNIAKALTNDAGTGARQNPDLTQYTDKDLQDFIDNPQSALKISQGGKGKVSKQEAPADKLKAAAQRELKKRQQATSFDDTPATPKKTTTTQPTGTVAERAKAHTKNIDQKLYKAKTNFDTTRQNHPAGTPEFQKAEREYAELNVESAKQHRDFEQQELDTRKQNGQPTKAQQKRLDRTEANLQKAQQQLDTLNELRDNFAKTEAEKQRIQTRRRDLYNQEQHQAPATELTAGLQNAHREATIGKPSRFTDEGRKATEKFNREHPLASYEELAEKIREQEWADFQNADDNYRLVSINQMKDKNGLGAHLTDEYADAANKNGGFPTATANTPAPTTSDPQTTNPGRLNDEDLIAEYHRIKGNKQARQQNLNR